MNNSERLYNIEDTLQYLNAKVEKENRLIINLLRKIIDDLNKKKNENESYS